VLINANVRGGHHPEYWRGGSLRLAPIGVDLTGILGGGAWSDLYYKSPPVEAKNTFSYIVMQVM